MTDNTESLILELLRAIRADLSVVKSDVRELKSRTASMESHMASFYGDVARHTSKFDELDIRIERIEQRLELQG